MLLCADDEEGAEIYGCACDAMGNIRVAKDKSSDKVDGIVAAVMALARAQAAVPPRRSAYEDSSLVLA